MLKYALLGAAMAISAPAFAQTQTTPAPAAPAQVAPAPTTTAAPVADPAGPAADATAAAPPTAADTTAAAPAPKAEQVASAIDDQFTTYDKDANGKLNEVEFSAWMVALKSQADPKTDANAPATKKWNKAAFAQADKDKSKSLSKDEVASFLTPASAKS